MTFAVQGSDIYYIHVVGFAGDTNFDYSLAVDAPTEVFETGYVFAVGTEWQSVDFEREFIDPVVILTLPTFYGSEPVTTRIQNVTGTGFELQLMQWNYQDGSAVTEDIGYFVIEAGHHIMDDGTVIQAGIVDSVRQEFDKGLHPTPFSNVPVVIAQIEASHNRALVPRIIDSSVHAFGVRVQEQEHSRGFPKPANIHFVSLLAGTGELNGKPFEVGTIENTSTGSPRFQNPFASNPLVFGTLQSFKDTDPVNVRLSEVTTNDFTFQYQEEQSRDNETTHGGEQFGFLALATSSSFSRLGPGKSER